jgi:hypothetical protein
MGKTANSSTVIRPSKRIIYDTTQAVVSFLSEDVNTCVDEFLEEWATVSKMVVIAREGKKFQQISSGSPLDLSCQLRKWPRKQDGRMFDSCPLTFKPLSLRIHKWAKFPCFNAEWWFTPQKLGSHSVYNMSRSTIANGWQLRPPFLSLFTQPE